MRTLILTYSVRSIVRTLKGEREKYTIAEVRTIQSVKGSNPVYNIDNAFFMNYVKTTPELWHFHTGLASAKYNLLSTE